MKNEEITKEKIKATIKKYISGTVTDDNGERITIQYREFSQEDMVDDFYRLISTIRREALEGFYARLLREWIRTSGFEYGDKTMKEVMEEYLQENAQ